MHAEGQNSTSSSLQVPRCKQAAVKARRALVLHLMKSLRNVISGRTKLRYHFELVPKSVGEQPGVDLHRIVSVLSNNLLLFLLMEEVRCACFDSDRDLHNACCRGHQVPARCQRCLREWVQDLLHRAECSRSRWYSLIQQCHANGELHS